MASVLEALLTVFRRTSRDRGERFYVQAMISGNSFREEGRKEQEKRGETEVQEVCLIGGKKKYGDVTKDGCFVSGLGPGFPEKRGLNWFRKEERSCEFDQNWVQSFN